MKSWTRHVARCLRCSLGYAAAILAMGVIVLVLASAAIFARIWIFVHLHWISALIVTWVAVCLVHGTLDWIRDR